MKQILLPALIVSALFFSFQRVSEAQAKPDTTVSLQDKSTPKSIALKSGEPKELTYDAGTMRLLASSEDTNGAWSLIELKEMPGYHTNFHRHNYTDGVLCHRRHIDS